MAGYMLSEVDSDINTFKDSFVQVPDLQIVNMHIYKKWPFY